MTDWNGLSFKEKLLDWGCSFSTRIEAVSQKLRRGYSNNLQTAQSQLQTLEEYRLRLINLIEQWKREDDT